MDQDRGYDRAFHRGPQDNFGAGRSASARGRRGATLFRPTPHQVVVVAAIDHRDRDASPRRPGEPWGNLPGAFVVVTANVTERDCRVAGLDR